MLLAQFHSSCTCSIVDFKYPLKKDLALEFCRNQSKDFSILTDTHINHDQIHHIRNNWLDPIFFSPRDNHTKGFVLLLHSGLEGVTKVEADPKRRYVSFKVTPSNKRVFFVYATSGHKIREHLVREHFFEGLQNYMESKSEGNENKIILGEVNCTVDKMAGMVIIRHKKQVWWQLCSAKSHRE